MVPDADRATHRMTSFGSRSTTRGKLEIDILTEKEDSERRQAEFKDRTETLIKNLEIMYM